MPRPWEKPELSRDERYATHSARGQRQTELDELINDWTRTHDLKPLEALLGEAGVPCGLIYKARDMLEDEHFKAREAIVSVDHPEFGQLRMQNVVPKLSDTPGEVRHVGPELGEHNERVFENILSMDAEQMADYKTRGII